MCTFSVIYTKICCYWNVAYLQRRKKRLSIPLIPSCSFKQCYSYEITIFKSALMSLLSSRNQRVAITHLASNILFFIYLLNYCIWKCFFIPTQMFRTRQGMKERMQYYVMLYFLVLTTTFAIKTRRASWQNNCFNSKSLECHQIIYKIMPLENHIIKNILLLTNCCLVKQFWCCNTEYFFCVWCT